jgi:hypothetical protein
LREELGVPDKLAASVLGVGTDRIDEMAVMANRRPHERGVS